jgi:hypothetical protein
MDPQPPSAAASRQPAADTGQTPAANQLPAAVSEQPAAASKQQHTAKHAAALPLVMPLFDCPTVYYLQSGDPASSLSLLHSEKGTSYPFARCIYDSGSNLNLISSSYCEQHGIEFDPSEGTSMLTSSGAVSKTVGRVCTPLHFSLPNPKGGTVKVRVVFQVVHASADNFDMLLGTPFMNMIASWVDVPSSTLCYRPFWHSARSPDGCLSIPIVTTTDAPDAAYRNAIAPRK